MHDLGLPPFSALSIALIACVLTACGGMKSSNANANASASNNANKAPAAAAANANQPAATNSTNTAAAPVNLADAEEIEGELQVGKTESVILYVGQETGDYAAFCFVNDSDVGKAIMAGCKDGDWCKVMGVIDFEASCTVPGLEATLSAAGRITKVASVKSSGPRKRGP